jgi:hypothetical protein
MYVCMYVAYETHDKKTRKHANGAYFYSLRNKLQVPTQKRHRL